MFEIYGWITISDWTIDYKEAIDIIKTKISESNLASLRIEITSTNETIISVSGITNRDRGYVQGIKDLVQRIFEISELSYGIFYYSRNENGIESFDVMVIRKNTIEIKNDTWLSPRFPMIEDG